MRALLRPLLAASLAAAALPHAAPAQVSEVQVAPPFVRMRPGAQVQVLATAYDRAGIPIDARLFWASSNINVATVDSAGTVSAVAPGVAIVTAASDSSGARRRSGRTTIFVSQPGAIGGKQLAAAADTLPPASCEEPEFSLRNPGRVCWDTRPNVRGTFVLAAPEQCTERPVRPAVFLARVSAEGVITELRTRTESSCPAYQAAATELIRLATFRPGYRNRRPVAVWHMLVVHTAAEPPRVFVNPRAPLMPGTATPPRTPLPPAPGKQGPRP